ncbi:ABC transporter substrate-binding protein [Rhizobium sp. BK376]|uniref:ABC transporter substrate-binding protein n=1 Tax=Rhizobium sp. BK376 TaxID=2512149 RepID=UPI0010D34354|nr:ABC transporter substrate-binding protein [Rhizobium sp. BK376]TCR74804.1 NitT/TauT family transport system substrate-binding protein [Rhizobium sp. BK376]
MPSLSFQCLSGPVIALVTGLMLAAPAGAEQLVVSNYGVSANGMPFAVAMAKGYFKDEGANVTGIVTSDGGGTTLRNMLAGDVPYGEVNPSVVVSAIQKGADIKIVSDNVSTVAEFVWAVKPDSPIKTVKDLKGKKIAYTNPRSTSQALATLLLQSGGLKTEDAELVKTGGFGEGVAALDTDLVDIAPIPEPLWSKFKDKYRPVAKATDILPPLENVIGVVSESQAKAKGDFIRAVIRARRKAVDFMIQHPDEAGDIVAKAYNLDPAVGRAAVTNLTTSRTQGMPYWGPGTIHMAGLQRMIDLQKSVGAISGDADVSKMIDTSFLPDDIKGIQ